MGTFASELLDGMYYEKELGFGIPDKAYAEGITLDYLAQLRRESGADMEEGMTYEESKTFGSIMDELYYSRLGEELMKNTQRELNYNGECYKDGSIWRYVDGDDEVDDLGYYACEDCAKSGLKSILQATGKYEFEIFECEICNQNFIENHQGLDVITIVKENTND